MGTSASRGFTLVELLCVLFSVCVLSGAAALFFLGDGDERRIVREEAEDLCAWLTAKMAFAAREGANFQLSAHLYDYDAIDYRIRIQWDGGSKDLKDESYYPKRASIGLASGQYSHTFDGEWFTLTPAASFIIRSRKDSSIRLVVTVSGAGFADVKETLEGQ